MNNIKRIIVICLYFICNTLILFAQQEFSHKYKELGGLYCYSPDSLQKIGKYIESVNSCYQNLSKYPNDMSFSHFYRLAENYAILGDFDSAFYYLNRYIDVSVDDRMIIVDRIFFVLRNDTIRWQNIIEKINNGYLSSLDSASNKLLALRLFYFGIKDQEYTYLSIMEQLTDSIILKIRYDKKYLYDSLKQIVKQYGFPTLSMVGKLACESAFLILQHHPPIKNKYYNMVKAAYLNHDFPPSAYAYLTDRRLMQKHRKQIYGTQWVMRFQPDKKYNGQTFLYPVRNFKYVNERRKQMGLRTVEESIIQEENYCIPEKYYKNAKNTNTINRK